MDFAIEIENIHKDFGKNIKALDGVSFSIPSGKIFGLLGPNGAGKTTLVRILTTLLLPTSGYARVAGYDVVRDASLLREVIGLTGQYGAIDDNMTGFENLYMVGKLYHLSGKEAKRRAEGLLEKFDLIDAAKRLVKTYSGGMRRRLDLCASLVGDPKVLFLDEPTTGLDPKSRIALWEIIEDLVKSGTTILLTTQYLEEADKLSQNLAVIDKGRIIAKGSPQELKSRFGGDVVELHIKNKSETKRAAFEIATLGAERPHIEEDVGRITLPVSDGAGVLVDVIRVLDREKIFIEDIILRRPTLDEVFLKLTGHEAEERQEFISNIEKKQGGEIFIYENK